MFVYFVVYFIVGTTPPIAGLYFIFNSTVYLPGDIVLITNIGRSHISQPNAGLSLVCVTANVNEEGVGNWFFPNGSFVPNRTNTAMTRSAFAQQIRLDHNNGTILPIGMYTCEVPDGRNSSVTHTAKITLALKGTEAPISATVKPV